MIDRAARDRLALALRRLAAGRITNDEFEDQAGEFLARNDRPGFCDCGYDVHGAPHERCPECGMLSDPALSAGAYFGWAHYSDVECHKLRGKYVLTRKQRLRFARAILFLKGDREYRREEFLLSSSSDRPVSVWWAVVLVIAAAACVVGAFRWGAVALVPLVIGYVLVWMVDYAARRIRRWTGRQARDEAIEEDRLVIWPFTSASDASDAVQRPTFLRG